MPSPSTTSPLLPNAGVAAGTDAHQHPGAPRPGFRWENNLLLTPRREGNGATCTETSPKAPVSERQ